MEKKKSNPKNKTEQMTPEMKKHRFNGIDSDVLGSYTGTGTDNDPPEQDADDL